LAGDLSNIPGLCHVARLPLPNPKGPPVQAWLVRYSTDGFDPMAFEAHGIRRPPELLRSVEKRQAEYLFGRLAARLALTELGATDWEVRTGTHRQPLWPPGMTGSITHSGGYAAAVAMKRGDRSAIGIDIEGVATGDALRALVDLALSAEELGRLRALERTCSLRVLVTLVFSAKEAFFKAAFSSVGRYFDFSAIHVLEVDLEGRRLTMQVQEPLSAALAPGALHTATFGFLAPQVIYTACRW
jgi:4'-phosphopantetheinyl transferase EntD